MEAGLGLEKQKFKINGVGYVLIISLFFGLMPAITQLSFKAGLSVETMLASRYFLTLLITWCYIWVKGISFRIEKSQLVFLMAIGVIYIGVAVFINQAYQYLPGAIASMLVFTYVSMTLIMAIVIGREKPNLIKGICVLLSLAGIILIAWNPMGTVRFSSVGLISVFLAAFFYALYAIFLGDIRLSKIDNTVIVGYMLIAPSIFNILRCLVEQEPLLPASPVQSFYVLILAVFCTFLAQLWFCKAVKLIGSSSTAIINTIEPVIAYFAGMVLLHDLLSLNAILGGVLIVLSIILLNSSDVIRARIHKSKSKKGFTLIELIVVIVIIGILAAIIVPKFSGFVGNSKSKICEANRSALERHYTYCNTNTGISIASGETIVAYLAKFPNHIVDGAYTPCPSGGDIEWEFTDAVLHDRIEVTCSLHSDAVINNTLFSSTFDNMTDVGNLGTSKWAVSSTGKLITTKTGENRALFAKTNGTDYQIAMKATYLSGKSSQSGYGIYYRATEITGVQESKNISGYCFQYDPGAKGFKVNSVTQGKEKTIAMIQMSKIMDSSFDVKAEHDIIVSIVGDQHVIKIDGKTVLSFKDSTYQSGSVGVRAWNDTQVEIDSITVDKN